jgi:hypothetical protein
MEQRRAAATRFLIGAAARQVCGPHLRPRSDRRRGDRRVSQAGCVAGRLRPDAPHRGGVATSSASTSRSRSCVRDASRCRSAAWRSRALAKPPIRLRAPTGIGASGVSIARFAPSAGIAGVDRRSQACRRTRGYAAGAERQGAGARTSRAERRSSRLRTRAERRRPASAGPCALRGGMAGPCPPLPHRPAINARTSRSRSCTFESKGWPAATLRMRAMASAAAAAAPRAKQRRART